MAQFIITYFGGNKPITPEESKQHFAEYQAWLAELGDAVVSPANPFKDTHTIHSDGTVAAGSSTIMSGYTLLEAETIEDALDMAKQCPFLDINGTLEVSELVKMDI
ncbi:hypothetical protein SAMN02745866_00989 [Alteromonadaceae bacterium Bs31]|nr:hypothetical protein SAMN02745866_00989 [Alteromonadaceae bacterium Bs31]